MQKMKLRTYIILYSKSIYAMYNSTDSYSMYYKHFSLPTFFFLLCTETLTYAKYKGKARSL